MNIRHLFLTESKRSFKLFAVMAFCFFVLGFAVTSMLVIQKQMQALLNPISWDADMVILPKGVSLDGLHRSLITGNAEGLIPLALFQTLESQAYNSPLKVLAFTPYREDGQVKVGLEGSTIDFPWQEENSVWKSLKTTPRKDLEQYQTQEWGQKVLAGVLARGPKIALESLKTLIDRRTIAQAWYVNSEMSDDVLRVAQLRRGMEALTGLIVLCLAPGLVLSTVIVRERLKNLLTVIQELGVTRDVRGPLYSLQFLAWVLVPTAVGLALALSLAPVWLSFLTL